MLEKDLIRIGNRLFEARKRLGLTQAQVAEIAEISDRTYADIERGTVNMRAETLVSICAALKLTPDAVLTVREPDESDIQEKTSALLVRLSGRSEKEKRTALNLLSVYLDSLN
jgi:transcriptional regulator with XRE-family HTH domain